MTPQCRTKTAAQVQSLLLMQRILRAGNLVTNLRRTDTFTLKSRALLARNSFSFLEEFPNAERIS